MSKFKPAVAILDWHVQHLQDQNDEYGLDGTMAWQARIQGYQFTWLTNQGYQYSGIYETVTPTMVIEWIDGHLFENKPVLSTQLLFQQYPAQLKRC